MAAHDRTVRALAAAAAAASVILTAAAFWLSYSHLHDVSDGHGLHRSASRAWAWPATVDLFIMVGELLILRASLAGRIDPWAICLTVLGSGSSIALNIAGVGTQAPMLDQIVAAVPPVAALLAFGAIMRQIHEYITAHPGTAPDQRNEQPPSTPAAPQLQLVSSHPTGLLTREQVMQLKGCSRATIGRWQREGRLTPVTRDANGRNLYDPAQIA